MSTVTSSADFIDGQDGVTNSGDWIWGYEGNDVIVALGGDDRIVGGAGADTIYGGSGNDLVSYEGSSSSVAVNLMNGSSTGGDANGDALFNIEHVSGSEHDDLLIGNDGDNFLIGEGGRDILKGGGGADSLAGGAGDDTLSGGAGLDLLVGAEGNDTLYGESSRDTLIGGLGNDTMSGGTEDDTYYVDTAGDVVSEAARGGNDLVYSLALGYTLTANVETLSLAESRLEGQAVYGTGNAQANTIFGNFYDNVLEGGGGADILNGLGGNDNFVFRPGDANGDTIHEFAGNGAGIGDFMYFIGYGTAAQGASFVQLTATTKADQLRRWAHARHHHVCRRSRYRPRRLRVHLTCTSGASRGERSPGVKPGLFPPVRSSPAPRNATGMFAWVR